MLTRGFTIIAVCLALVAPLAGCGGGGSESMTNQEIRTTTTGQELSDLKKAYESGAMTEDEYETERKNILDRAN